MPKVRWLAIALALLTTPLGVRFGTFVAIGSDAYGYVSEATSGHFHRVP